MGGDLSGMQTQGAAFRPWGPTRAGGGVGTYGAMHGGAFGPYQARAGRKASEGMADQSRKINVAVNRLGDAVVNAVNSAEDRVRRNVRESFSGRGR